jgi:glutamate synthase domain-containing protein 1
MSKVMNVEPAAQLIPQHPVDDRERDACALICAVRKGGQATHGNVKRTIEALTRMGHRTGSADSAHRWRSIPISGLPT